MPRLTAEQLAKRRASKKNNRLRRDMPLFADALQPGGALESMLTSVDEELPAVIANQERGERFSRELRARYAEWLEREAAEKQKALAGRSAEDVAYLEERRKRYPKTGEYGVTYWKQVQEPGWIEADRERTADMIRRRDKWDAELAAARTRRD